MQTRSHYTFTIISILDTNSTKEYFVEVITITFECRMVKLRLGIGRRKGLTSSGREPSGLTPCGSGQPH